MKRTLIWIAVMIGAAGCQTTAFAQAWPARFVRVIVPFSAGGAADVVTRIVTARVGENLGQTFVIENRTGSSGNIGTEAVAKSDPDGYTFLAGSPGTLAINPAIYRKLPYNAETDFVLVTHVATFPQVLAVNAKVPAATLDEFVTYAKATRKTLSFGSSGNGSTGHLITAMFLSQVGIEALHIPYRGGGPAAQGLASNDVEFVVDGLPTFVGLAQSNAVRILAITSAQRWPELPDVPAIGEHAVPGFDLSSWVVFAAPKGTPSDIVDRFAAEVRKAVAAEDVRRRLSEVGALPVGSSPQDAVRFHRAELAKWKRVVEVSGAKVE